MRLKHDSIPTHETAEMKKAALIGTFILPSITGKDMNLAKTPAMVDLVILSSLTLSGMEFMESFWM